MITSFDPENLAPSASLNRMPMAPLPGVALEADAVGQPASALLSLEALARGIRRRAPMLRIDAEHVDDTQLPLMLDRCFASNVPGVRAGLEEIAATFGRRLGHLVLTLKRGDSASRAARPDWDAGYWRHWAGVRRIWVGGGLVGGRLGPCIIRHAEEYLVTGGEVECALAVAEHSAVLPLIGAARSVPAEYGAALVFDFGSTAIKRARASYENGALSALRLLSPAPVRSLTPERLDGNSDVDLLQRASRIATLLAETWQEQAEVEPDLAPSLICSLACYVAGNHPLPRQGGFYAALHAVAGNLGRWLSPEVSARLTRPIEVILLHDGTAAARTYAGVRNAAVIMMGTALGAGYPQNVGELWPVAPSFVVYPASSDAIMQS